jgi:hypothetical protein
MDDKNTTPFIPFAHKKIFFRSSEICYVAMTDEKGFTLRKILEVSFFRYILRSSTSPVKYLHVVATLILRSCFIRILNFTKTIFKETIKLCFSLKKRFVLWLVRKISLNGV